MEQTTEKIIEYIETKKKYDEITATANELKTSLETLKEAIAIEKGINELDISKTFDVPEINTKIIVSFVAGKETVKLDQESYLSSLDIDTQKELLTQFGKKSITKSYYKITVKANKE